jgi:hypothetical protein
MTTPADDLRTLGHEAYVYLYPLVTMDVTREMRVSRPAGSGPGAGPPNRFHHLRAFPAADFRAVVRPNFDTLYSTAWLDLTEGPVRVSLGDTGGRYVLMAMLDMWTDVFAAPGRRTTGTGAQSYLLVPPGAPAGDAEGRPVVRAPTPCVWIIGRTQTDGVDDYAAAHAVQDGFTITPRTPPADRGGGPASPVEEPLGFVDGLSAVGFFLRGAAVLGVQPPHATDFSVLARIAGIGVIPGRPFPDTGFSRQQLDEIQAGVTEAQQRMLAARSRLGRRVNGWSMVTEGIGVYGNDYFRRAVVAMTGLGANPPGDAVYPVLVADADGDPPTGEHDYVIHFDAGALPPVGAFWSVTMYDEDGFPVPNELDRYCLGDRDRLHRKADGSLDIVLARTRPGAGRDTNWLPAPSGPLGVTMRLYAPHADVLTGAWEPPPVRKA